MIYIKRFLYILFMIAMYIIAMVIFIIAIITFPFISMVDYIMYGKLTKDPVIKIYDWFENVLYKFKPE